MNLHFNESQAAFALTYPYESPKIQSSRAQPVRVTLDSTDFPLVRPFAVKAAIGIRNSIVDALSLGDSESCGPSISHALRNNPRNSVTVRGRRMVLPPVKDERNETVNNRPEILN